MSDLASLLLLHQFLLIFRKAAAGELPEDSGLGALALLSEIDVSSEGVKGAKSFFEAKVGRRSGGSKPQSFLCSQPLCAQVHAVNASNRFEEEIRQEQELRKKEAEEQKRRRAAFKEKQSAFK